MQESLQTLFNPELKKVVRSSAKTIVYLLSRAADAARDATDAALAHLERLAALLEQYYHPSNTSTHNGGQALLQNVSARQISGRT